MGWGFFPKLRIHNLDAEQPTIIRFDKVLFSRRCHSPRRDPCGIADSLSDASIIEIYRDYRIRANRLGLYTLASSITGVLSGVNGSEKGDGITVFALDVGSHALRVELVD